MSLENQTKTVFMNRGMRDDVDYTLLEPPFCQLVRNGRFVKRGSISKRLPVDIKIVGGTSGAVGDPLAILERENDIVVQGTDGAYAVVGEEYKEIPSKIKPSTVDHKFSTIGRRGHRLMDFDVSGENRASLSVYRKDELFETVEMKYNVGGANVVLQLREYNIDDIVDVFVKITDNVVVFSLLRTNVRRSPSSPNTFLSSWLCNLDGSGFRNGVSKTFTGEAATNYSRLDMGECVGLPDCLYTFRGLGNGTVMVSAFAPTLVGSVSGYSNIDLVSQSRVGDTGYVFDSSGEYVTLRLSRSNATSINRYFTSTGFPVGNSERVDPGAPSETVIRVSMCHSESKGYSIAYLTSESSSAEDGVQFADFNANIFFPEDAQFGFRATSAQNSYTTYVYEKSPSWQLKSTIYEEGLCADIYDEDDGTLIVPCYPVHQYPMLAENPDGVAALSFPLGWKPKTTNLYAVTQSGLKSYAVLDANESFCWDGFRKSSLIGHDIFSSLPRVKSGYVPNRIIASAPDTGLVKTGLAYVPQKKDESAIAVHRFTVHSVTTGFSGRAVEFGKNIMIPSGSPGYLGESGILPVSFLNAPEITSVFYTGEFYRDGSLVNYTNALNEGFPSTGYSPSDLVLDSKFTQRSSNEPGNDSAGTSHNVLIVGINVVLSTTREDGTKIRSAPSQTLYVPAFYHEYIKPSSGDDTAFLVTLENLDIGVYTPAVVPGDVSYEVYITNTYLTGLGDPPVPISITEDPVLVGVFQPSNKNYSIDFGGVHNAVFKTRNRISVSNWAGYYQDSKDGHPNTEQGPRFQSRVDSSTEIIYTATEPSADTLGSVSQFASTGNTLFYVSGDKVGFFKPWRYNVAPEAPSLYIQDLPYSQPKHIVGMDDKLILFYDDFIYVLFGESPGVDGSGGGYETQKLPGEIGLRDVKSVVEVTKGIMFRSRRGFYILNRGLVLDYVGGVEDVIKGTTVSASVNADGESHVIFSLSIDEQRDSYNKLSLTDDHPPGSFLGNGNCEPIYQFIKTSTLTLGGGVGGALDFGLPEKPPDLGERTLVDQNPYAVVYNYDLEEWSVFTNHDFVASKDVRGRVYGVRSDWTLLEQRDPGSSGDTWGDDAKGTEILPGRNNLLKLRSAWVKFAALMDLYSLVNLTVLFRNLNYPAHGSDIRMILRQDYEATDAFDPGSYTHKQLRKSNDGGSLAPDRLQISLRPKRRRCQSFQLDIEEKQTNNEPGKSFTIGRGFEVIGIDPEAADVGGSVRLPQGRRK